MRKRFLHSLRKKVFSSHANHVWQLLFLMRQLLREQRLPIPMLPSLMAATDCLLTVKHEMDDAANAKPYAVFDLAWKVLRGKNGLAKDQYSAVMSDDLVDYILRTEEVMGSVVYVEPVVRMSKERKRQFLADYLGLKEIVPVSSIFDTSGLSQNANISKFWSNEYCLLAKLSDGRKTFRERCIGRQVVWTKYSPDYIIEDYPEPQKNSRVIRAREYRGIVINTDYGVLLKKHEDYS